MKNKNGYKYNNYKIFNNRREAKMYYDEPSLVRPKRNPTNLPDPWNEEKYVHLKKNWKENRKTKYRPDGRGKRHEIILPDRINKYCIREYFQNKNIPFEIVTVNKKQLKEINKWYYDYGTNQIILNNKVRKRYVSVFLYDKLVWWSDKDIGIEYIFKRLGSP